MHTPLPRPELDPRTLAIALLYGEIAPPELHKPFRYVEIGPGNNGLRTLAAQHPNGEFIGLTPTDLQSAPREIDILVLNSTWSSADDTTRAALQTIIANNLSTRGLVVIDYATSPGASIPATLRRIGLELGEKAEAAQSLFFKTNPLATQMLDAMRGRPMGAHFHVTSFKDISAWMSACGLTYAAPAKLVDAILKVNFAKEAALLLHNESDVVIREMKKDLMLNRGYRCDVFMRAPQKLESQAAAAQIARTVFTTTLAPEKIEKLTLLTAYAEIKPSDSARRLFEVLSKQPASALDLAQQRVLGCEDVWKNVDAMMVLLAMEAVTPGPVIPRNHMH
jgi:hypothetical protein